jgi:hypothetical protein
MNVDKEKAAVMLVDAGVNLKKLSSKNVQLEQALQEEREKRAMLEKRMEAEKVAADMHDRGVNLDVDFDKLASSLEKKPRERLEVIKEALSMQAPDMLRDARLSDSPAHGATDFERFILGDVG